MKIDVPLNLRYGGIAVLIIGPVMILLAGVSFLADRTAQSWPTVEARVVRSEVEVSKKVSGFRRSRTASSEYFTAAVAYEYIVDGKPYTGDRIHRSSNPSSFDHSLVEPWTRKYPQGAKITVYYSPRTPSLSVIDPTTDVMGLLLLFGGGVIMIPAGLVLLHVARDHQPAATRPVAPAAVTPARKKQIRGREPKQTHWLLRTFAVVLGLAFFLLGALIFPRCVELTFRAFKQSDAETADAVAAFITMAIMGGIGLFGAYLIVKGSRRVSAR